jgi:hypothetical protein
VAKPSEPRMQLFQGTQQSLLLVEIASNTCVLFVLLCAVGAKHVQAFGAGNFHMMSAMLVRSQLVCAVSVLPTLLLWGSGRLGQLLPALGQQPDIAGPASRWAARSDVSPEGPFCAPPWQASSGSYVVATHLSVCTPSKVAVSSLLALCSLLEGLGRRALWQNCRPDCETSSLPFSMFPAACAQHCTHTHTYTEAGPPGNLALCRCCPALHCAGCCGCCHPRWC